MIDSNTTTKTSAISTVSTCRHFDASAETLLEELLHYPTRPVELTSPKTILEVTRRATGAVSVMSIRCAQRAVKARCHIASRLEQPVTIR